MTFPATRARALLRAGVADPAARFRPGQQEAISHVVRGDGRLLLVQKTGWGKSFVYFIAATLPATLRVLATTATANDRVLADLSAVLGPDLKIARGDLARPSLALQTIRLPGQAERLAWLAEQLPRLPGSGIVYTLTVRDAEQVARWLRARGIAAEPYTSLSGPRRAELEQALLDNRLKALVATTALGMGFDKPDLAFVIHYQAPPSVVAYHQQVGRAGRALEAAHGVLLSGAEELAITDYFIDNAFPTRDQVADVLEALDAPEGLSTPGSGAVAVQQGVRRAVRGRCAGLALGAAVRVSADRSDAAEAGVGAGSRGCEVGAGRADGRVPAGAARVAGGGHPVDGGTVPFGRIRRGGHARGVRAGDAARRTPGRVRRVAAA